MRPNNHEFNHKLFHIFNNAEIQSNTNLSVTNSSIHRASALRLNQMHRSLSFDFSFLPGVPLLSNVSLVSVFLCFLIYKLLLLFIGNLKIASAQTDLLADLLSFKHCNNYLLHNLASEINSIELRCLHVDFSFFSN